MCVCVYVCLNACHRERERVKIQLSQFALDSSLSSFFIRSHLHNFQNSIEFMGVKIYGLCAGSSFGNLKPNTWNEYTPVAAAAAGYCRHRCHHQPLRAAVLSPSSLSLPLPSYCLAGAVFSQFDSTTITTIVAIFHTNFPSHRITSCT